MLAGNLAHVTDKNYGVPTETTVCKHLRHIKAVFKWAAEENVIIYSPFSHLSATPPEPDKDWFYLSIEDFDKLIKATDKLREDRPIAWKILLGLWRLAGLRQAEAFRLKWSDVDLINKRLTVRNPKKHKTTKKRTRTLPIQPKLHDILFAASMEGPDGEYVVQSVLHSTTNLRRTFDVLCKHAALTP